MVSVVMPNYNNELFLEEAINSILTQTFTDYEFLIIDDGSTDNSIEIIKSYADKRIRLICKKENSGIVDALNIGLDAAVGKYVIRMDGDDISVSKRFQILVDYMEVNPNICVCSSDMLSFGDEYRECIWRYGISIRRNQAEMIFSSSIGHASSIFRMEVFDKHQLRYEKGYPHIEDYRLFTRLNKIGEMYNLNVPLYNVRMNENSSTAINRSTHADRLFIIYRELLEEIGIHCTQKNSENKLKLHFELGKKEKPTFSYKDYFQWGKYLIAKNEEFKIYFEPEFSKVVHERLELIKYKIIEERPFQFFSVVRLEKTFDKFLFRYFIGVTRKKFRK